MYCLTNKSNKVIVVTLFNGGTVNIPPREKFEGAIVGIQLPPAHVRFSLDPIEEEGCPRKLSREEIIEGLKSGRALMVDRKDAPELLDLTDLEREGLVTSQLIEIDEQSSVRRFVWKNKD